MLDLLDLVSPRVYVVSEKHYEEILDKRRKAERERLEARRDYHKEALAKIEKELSET